MKVVLRYSSVSALPSSAIEGLANPERVAGTYHGHFAPIGTEFVVYGIEMAGGNVFFRVRHPPEQGYAILVLAAFFEIVDARVSRYWQAQMSAWGDVILAPASWAQPFYHDRLSDGDSELREDFRRTTDLLEAEATELS